MTKYSRITGKVFGAAADPTGVNPEIGQFGSALAGTYNGTSDIAEIQNLAAWDNGFIGCVTPTTQFPPLPEMTGFGKVLSHQICYLLQQGIAEWDSGTTYYVGNWCSYQQNLYFCIDDNSGAGITNILPTDDSKWTKYTGGFSRNYGEIITSSLPISDNTLHLADGSVLDSTNYSGLLSYINSIYPSSVTGDFTVATQNVTLGNNEWLGIAYGNGTYIALSSGGLTSTSTDGVNWTTPVQSLTGTVGSKWSTITYGNGIFVACRAGSSRTATYDGVNWTETINLSSINGTIHSVKYGKNIFLMVTETGYTYSSADGLNWTQKSVAPFSSFTQLIFEDNKFKCLAVNGVYMDLYETSDGSTWNNFTTDLSVISGTNQKWTTFFYDDEQYTAINQRGYVSTSIDGINWATPTQNANLGDPNHTWRNAVYAPEKLQTVVISTNGYISIKEYQYTDVFTTEANWQSSVSTYGECGKYVYDSVNNTLRLPLLNTYITSTTNARELGNLTPASIPNIKGTVNHLVLQDSDTNFDWTGAFYNASIGGNSYKPSSITKVTEDIDNIGIDASRLSSVYSNSATTVNTQSIKQLVYIVVRK